MRKTEKNRKSSTGKSTRNRKRIEEAVHFEGLETRQMMATINVTDFGARPNDGADDRAAVQNAINSSKAGDTILFNGGTFNFSNDINILGGRTLRGQNNTILRGKGQDGELVKIRASDVTFQGFTLEGGGIFLDKPGGGKNNNILIDSNTIKLDTTGSHRSAITFTSGLSYSKISNNYLTGYKNGFGIYGYHYDHLTISNNELVNITAGMHIDAFGGSGHLLVEQNFLSGINGMGMEFQTTGSADPGATNLVFQDNWFEKPVLDPTGKMNWNSFAYSLPLDKAVNVTVRRNVIIAPERPPGDKGIRIGFELGGDNTLLEDNYVYGTNHVVAANDGSGSESVTARNNRFVNYLQGPSIAFPASNRTFVNINNGPNVRLSDVMEARLAANDKPGIGSKRYDGSVQPSPNPTPTPNPDPTPEPDPVQKPPSAPTGLLAMVTGPTSVNLFWTDKSNREAGYKVQRSTDGQNWTTIATLATDDASHTVTGLTAGQTYSFRVNAFNDGGSSAYTNTATAKPAEFDSAKGTYLSDMEWTSADNDLGPAERDMSVGDRETGDGGVLQLGEKTYAKGLGVHSHSELHYALDGKYTNFLSDIGVDAEVGSKGSVVFEVWADGEQLFTSDTLTGESAVRSINVNVAGKKELVLIVNNDGDNRLFDHADWAGARLISKPVVNPDPDPDPDPDPQPVPADPDATYISDMEWTSATNLWGEVEKDMSNGEREAGDGNPLTLDGKTYTKGLGVHGRSDVRYKLNGKYGMFIADIGIDEEVGENGTVIFQVLGDGVVLYDSGRMTHRSPTRTININVQGRRELQLRVGNGKDDNDFDHANWANARLTPAPGSVVFLSDLPDATDTSNGKNDFKEDVNIQGQEMSLARRSYAKGLGVKSDSKLIYQLGGLFETFTTDLGIDDEMGGKGSVIFKIYADGEKVYESGEMTGLTPTRSATVSVSGKKELWLVVDDAGDGVEFDHADWAGARLVA